MALIEFDIAKRPYLYDPDNLSVIKQDLNDEISAINRLLRDAVEKASLASEITVESTHIPTESSDGSAQIVGTVSDTCANAFSNAEIARFPMHRNC